MCPTCLASLGVDSTISCVDSNFIFMHLVLVAARLTKFIPPSIPVLAQAEYEKENELRVLAAQNMLDTSEEEEEEKEEDVEVGDYGELKEDCREGREEGG